MALRVVVVKGPGELGIEEAPRPRAERGELVVRMSACGICGTDLEKLQGEALTPPILGHEVVGEVTEVGEGVEGFRPGDRVFVHHHVPCYKCSYCLAGEPTLCPSFVAGNLEPGGLAEFFKVPKEHVGKGAVLKLPPNLDDEEGIFIEPLGCCLRGLERVRPRPGEGFLILGLGTAGLLHLKLANLLGASRLIGYDPSTFRASFAKKLGALAFSDAEELGDALGEGLDLAIVATGVPMALSMALESVRRGGRILLFGAPKRGAKLEMPLDQLFIRQLSIIPSYSTTERETLTALRLLEAGRINAKELITHRFRLEEAREAFSVAMDSERSIKVLISP